MRRIISVPILMKLLICAIIVQITGVVKAGESSTTDVATAATLQREVDSLQERLELFEMKHETLQAASEQFKIQSKSAKLKLDEERKRYDILASEKRSLVTGLETKLENALEDQKSVFDDTILSEHKEKQNLLEAEKEELDEELRLSEQQRSMKEKGYKAKLQEQNKRFEMLEKKKLASDDKLRSEIADLKKRLSYSESQTESFEESWRSAIAESDAKDELVQEESIKRVEEAGLWEQRINKLNTDSKNLLSDLETKDDELTKSKRAHTLLFENVRKSDERIQQHDAQIKTMTAENQNLTNELKSRTDELMRSKKAHTSLLEKYENNSEIVVNDLRQEIKEKDAKTEALQNEIVDIKFELDTSQSEMKQSIQEKSKLTKTYTEALNKLTTKNNGLRNIVVDTKFELENSQNQTKKFRLEAIEINKAQDETLKQLESEGKKLKASRTELVNLKREYELMTDRFHESDEKVQGLLQRIDEEATKYAEIQNELLDTKSQVEKNHIEEKKLREAQSELAEIKEALDTKEKNLVESKQNFKIIKEHNAMLQEKLRELEGKVEELTEELELKASKTSYLQKTLLDTKNKLEDSQSKAKRLEEMQADSSATSTEVLQLEIENNKITKQKNGLERELQESTTLYVGISREMNVLRDQLNATESKSTKISNMYESLKVEKDVLGRNLRAASLDVQEKISAFEQCDKELRIVQSMHTTEAQLDTEAKSTINSTETSVLPQETEVVSVEETSKGESQSSNVQEVLSEENATINEVASHIDNSTSSDPSIEDEIQSSNVQEIQDEANDMMNEVPSHVDNSKSSDPSIENDSTSTPTPTQNTWGWFTSIVSFFRWLDYALYKILRVVVDSAGLLTNGFGKVNSSFSFGWVQNGIAPFARFAANFKYMFSIVALVLNEFRIIHDALVSLFEFEMTFVSSLLSSEQDRSGFSFLIRHSNMIVIFGEVIAALLGLDYIISSFLYPRRRRKRPTAKTIEVPKTANASLLRKANNL